MVDLLEIFKVITDSVRAFYQTLRNRPKVTCDVRGVFKARWSPDFFPNEDGEVDAEGIRIETVATIVLANNGPIDTALKNIYVICKSHKKELGRLSCYFNRETFCGRELIGTIIEPRRVWGPEHIKIEGSLWDISEPPKDLSAELVVEAIAQRPIRRKISLWL